ncbi:MAG TPA: hypothetical protein PLQ04_07280, partial [Lachnospiraceae bacterium]|nr:hypothetical protein [Lachnospiraceae bacterium]
MIKIVIIRHSYYKLSNGTSIIGYSTDGANYQWNDDNSMNTGEMAGGTIIQLICGSGGEVTIFLNDVQVSQVRCERNERDSDTYTL